MNLLHLHPSLVSYSCLFGVASTHPPFLFRDLIPLRENFKWPPPPNNFVTYFLKPKFKSTTNSDLFQGSGPPEKIARLLSLVMDPFVGCNSSLSQVMISAHWRLKIIEEPWVFPLHWREKPFLKYFASQGPTMFTIGWLGKRGTECCPGQLETRLPFLNEERWESHQQ